MTDREAIKRALYDGIEWQNGIVAAYSHIDGSLEGLEAEKLSKKYRSILRKRYGIVETPSEIIEKTWTSVSIYPHNDLVKK